MVLVGCDGEGESLFTRSPIATKPGAQSAEDNTVIISLKLGHRTPSKYLYRIRQI